MTQLVSIREWPVTLSRDRYASPERPLHFFFIRHQGRNLKIRVADINYIEARKNYCKLVTKKGDILTLVTLKRMEQILPPDGFCRIHRAFIVALEWMTAFDCHHVYGESEILPIGETFRKTIFKQVVFAGGQADLDTETED